MILLTVPNYLVLVEELPLVWGDTGKYLLYIVYSVIDSKCLTNLIGLQIS